MRSDTDLVAHVVAAIAYMARAFEVVLDLDLSTEDHEVVLDQLDAAGEHVALAIWTLHPQWRGLDRHIAERKALDLFRRHRPEMDEADGAVRVLEDAIGAVNDGAVRARSLGRERRYRDCSVELDCAAEHLENARYVIDPESFGARFDGLSPVQRVKLASRIEIIELALEEAREFVRLRSLERLMSDT